MNTKTFTVYCLYIDLIGSTKAGLARTTQQNDNFNEALVTQIQQDLQALELENGVLKFTGDGWLLMTSNTDQVQALCCLALIQSRLFRTEMARLTGTTLETIPPLRLTICTGRDVSVKLPDGRLDWVGDSARRANRAFGFCRRPPDAASACEVLLDWGVQAVVVRDFKTERLPSSRKSETKPSEEAVDLYQLKELRPEAGAQSNAPQCFVYTMGVLGMTQIGRAHV